LVFPRINTLFFQARENKTDHKGNGVPYPERRSDMVEHGGRFEAGIEEGWPVGGRRGWEDMDTQGG